MEKFNLKEHWDKFSKGKLAVNCRTFELAKEFLDYCHSQGIVWCDGESLSNNYCWNNFKENICYYVQKNKMTCDGLKYFKREIDEIVKFEGFNNIELNDNNILDNIEVIYYTDKVTVIIKNKNRNYTATGDYNGSNSDVIIVY